MDNEEAIKYLIAPIATSTEPSAEYLKQKAAYELAIKALETGEVYMTGVDYNLYIEGYKDGKRDFEPKQGEWIHLYAIGDYKCSICGCENLYKYANEHERWVKTNSNFCPNCGAKLQKVGVE